MHGLSIIEAPLRDADDAHSNYSDHSVFPVAMEINRARTGAHDKNHGDDDDDDGDGAVVRLAPFET